MELLPTHDKYEESVFAMYFEVVDDETCKLMTHHVMNTFLMLLCESGYQKMRVFLQSPKFVNLFSVKLVGDYILNIKRRSKPLTFVIANKHNIDELCETHANPTQRQLYTQIKSLRAQKILLHQQLVVATYAAMRT